MGGRWSSGNVEWDDAICVIMQASVAVRACAACKQGAERGEALRQDPFEFGIVLLEWDITSPHKPQGISGVWAHSTRRWEINMENDGSTNVHEQIYVSPRVPFEVGGVDWRSTSLGQGAPCMQPRGVLQRDGTFRQVSGNCSRRPSSQIAENRISKGTDSHWSCQRAGCSSRLSNAAPLRAADAIRQGPAVGAAGFAAC